MAGDQIYIQALKRGRSATPAAARAFLEQIKVDRRREAERWVITVSWPGAAAPPVQWTYLSVQYLIRVPSTMRLEAHNGSGSIEARGVRQARLQTGSGLIHTVDIRGPLQAHADSGLIQMRECSGPVRADVDGGNIEMDTVRAMSALEAQLEIGSGRIDVSLPPTASVRIEAEIGSGQITMEPAGSARYNGEHNHLQAVLGTGGGSLRLRAGSGRIRIRRAADH